MWRVSASGGAPERVPINGQRPSSLDISRQGNRLVWTESSGDSNIWMFRGPGFAGRRAGQIRRCRHASFFIDS